MRMTLLLLALLTLAGRPAFADSAAAAEEISPLPFELAAEAGEIQLEIDNVSLDVVVAPGVAPTLQAGLYSEQAPKTSFTVRREGDRLTVRRTGGEAPSEPAVWVLLTLGPTQRLRVGGATVRLTLDASRLPAGEPTPQPTLALRGSEIRLTAVPGAHIDAQRSRLDLVSTRGSLELSLDGSSARIEDHQGSLKLAGSAAQIDLLRQQGRLDFELAESDLTVTGGSSELRGTAQGGSLRLEAWDGTGSVEAQGSRIAVQGLVSSPGQPPFTTDLRLSGGSLAVSVVGFEGSFDAQLEGGTLDGSNLVGKTRITARGAASVILEAVRKSLEISLYDSSVGRLRQVDGRVAARVTASTLEAEDVRMLGIQAQGGEVTAERVTRLDTVAATDTRLDLRLPGLENDPALLLQGQAVARVLLPTPCVVRLASPVEEIDRHLRIVGCALTSPGSGNVGLREEGAVILKASLDGESLLEVEGGAAR